MTLPPQDPELRSDATRPSPARPIREVREFRRVCVRCHKTLPAAFVPFCDSCNGMVEIEHDLGRARLHDSDNPYVRFADLLPVQDRGLLPRDVGFTPTIHAQKLGEELGLPQLYLKNETVHPTGTTKDRMAAVALAYLHECGIRCFCTSSTGNSSTAYARAIERFPDIRMYLFTASKFRRRVHCTDSEQVVHFVLRGASFVGAFNHARQFAIEHGLVPERGFFNQGRREGLKLAFLEATDQVPGTIDWYVQAVSSAMGVYGTFKGARELLHLGRIARLPRLLCAQQASCSPMVRAWDDGSAVIRPEHVVKQPGGIADAILRGDPGGVYPYVHDIVKESGGTFVSAHETEIRDAQFMVQEFEGIRPCFSASTAVAGLARRVREGTIPRDDTVLINLTGRDRKPATDRGTVKWLERSGDTWVEAEPER